MADAAALPDLRATILRRVDLLAEDTRRILAAGSVLGRNFNVTLLAAMAQLDPDVIGAAIGEAVHAEVVVDEGDGRFMFSHALVQDALYSELGPTRRARLHLRAAESIETLYPEWIAAIAHHRCSALPAGDRALAVEYARRAGADADARGGHEQAVEHYERALAAARDDTVCCLDQRAEAALLCELGNACIKSGAAARAYEIFGQAACCAREVADPVLLAEAAIGLGGGLEESVGFQLGRVPEDFLDALIDSRDMLPENEQAWYAIVTARLAGARFDMGEVVQAQSLSAEALDIARESGDPRALAVALAMRHTSLSCPAALEDRLALDAELERMGAPPSAQATLWRVSDLLECGRITDADAEMHALANGPLSKKEPRTRWFMAHYLTMRAELDGRLEDAMELAEEAREVGTRLGGSTATVSYALQTFFLAREQHRLDGVPELFDALAAANPSQPGFVVAGAWARTETGRFAEARLQLDELAPNDFAILPSNGVWLSNLAVLADVCYALEAATEAHAIYELLLPYRDRHVVVSRFLSCKGSVEGPLGALALTCGELDRAETHLDRARAANEAIAAPLLVARTDLYRARLANARGDDERANELYREVGSVAEANGWTDLAVRAREG